jgi:hypothetical protein
MTELRSYLGERREEFETHYALALALEGRIFAGDEISIGETKLSARHLLTIKSGLIVHLYNIVESTMSLIIGIVGDAVGSEPPSRWSEGALREWLREHAVVRVNGNEDARLQTMFGTSRMLLSEVPLGRQQLRKPSGTWTDKHIATFAERLGFNFRLPDDMWRRISPRADFGDMTPLEFLADRRNALAHGRRSFEEGARDLTLAQIQDLSNVALDYLGLTVQAFQGYVEGRNYVVDLP